MPQALAVQLYSLREALTQDFNAVIARLGQIQYAAVEPFAGLPLSPAEAKAQFDAHGLAVKSAHLPLPLGDSQQESLETAAIYELDYLVIPYLPAEDFASLDAIKRTADRLNEANAVTRSAGMTLCYHNHWWEFASLDGEIIFDTLLTYLEESIAFEMDTYWVQVAGQSPLHFIQKLGARLPLLHIKDGPATNPEAAMLAVGEGVMDFHAIIKAADPYTQWLVVELDRCDTDMMTAIEKSYHYLVDEGLGRGAQ